MLKTDEPICKSRLPHYISGMNLSATNKNFLIMLFIFVHLEQNITQ